MADDWYYTQGHERTGPVSLARLKAMANEGWLTPNDLVWQQGMPNWVPAETVRGLFGTGLLQSLKGAVEGIAKHPSEADSKRKGMPTDTQRAGTVVSRHTARHANNNGPTLNWDNITPRHMLAGCGGFIAALGIAFTAVAGSPFALAFTLGGLALAAVGMHVEVGRILGQAIQNIGQALHESAIRRQEAKKIALEEQRLAVEEQKLAVEEQKLDLEARRLAHDRASLEQASAPVAAPMSSGVATGVAARVGIGVSTPVSKPVSKPVSTGVSTRVASPVPTFAATPPLPPHFQHLLGGSVVVINHPPVRLWSPGLAALLSFFLPGLGQLYKGQLINGIVWFVFVSMGYVALVVPGLILHFFCVLGALSGNPWSEGKTTVVRE